MVSLLINLLPQFAQICLVFSFLITLTKTPLWLVHPTGDNRLRTSLRIIRMDRPLANDHQDEPASCKWSWGCTGILQIIIRMDWPLANNHQDGPASCKWSYGWTSLLQMISLDGQAFCKWSSGYTGILQMIIRILWHLANDHPDGPTPCNLIIRMDQPLSNDHQDGLASCKWSSGWSGLL